MLFSIGFLTGSLFGIAFMYLGVFLFFSQQKPIERQINQWITQSKPKGDFIQAPTDTEISRKDKFNKLSKIKNEIRLGDILE